MATTLLVKCVNDVAVNLYKTNTDQLDRDDSGYDLYYCGEPITIEPFSTGMLGLGICAELLCRSESKHGYELWPRSSISKTPLMLANSIGLIDYGYRGEIKACVRNVSTQPYTVQPGDKLFQLCMPSKAVFNVCIVEKLSETVRGDGGFGSTSSVAEPKSEFKPDRIFEYDGRMIELQTKDGQLFDSNGCKVNALEYPIFSDACKYNIKTGDY